MGHELKSAGEDLSRLQATAADSGSADKLNRTSRLCMRGLGTGHSCDNRALRICH